MKNLILFGLKTHNFGINAFEHNNFILFGVVLYSMLWKERNSVIHQGSKRKLLVFMNLVHKSYLQYTRLYCTDILLSNDSPNRSNHSNSTKY